MERNSAFGEFTYNLESATDSSKLRQAAGRLFESLGFEFFMYSVYPSDRAVVASTGQELVLTNFPTDWLLHYTREGYGKIDPLPGFVVSQRRSCQWDHLIAATDLTPQQLRLKDDAYAARIASGITLRIGSRHGEFATLMCVPVRETSFTAEDFVELEPVLELVGNYFHAKALNVLLRERLAAQSQLTTKTLSSREREVLYWASLGKTGWETGTILGISQKSVEVYADNAKNKLYATNKTHAVAKAILCGIIPDLHIAKDFTQLAWRLGFAAQQQNASPAH